MLLPVLLPPESSPSPALTSSQPDPDPAEARRQFILHAAHIHSYNSSSSRSSEGGGIVPWFVPDPSAVGGITGSNSASFSKYSTLYGSKGARRHTLGSLRPLDLVQNDINSRLTLNRPMLSVSPELTTTNINYWPKPILSVSPELTITVTSPPGSAHSASKQPPPPLSPTDLLSMGKIQEFREKVGAGQVTMPKKDIWKCLGAEFLGTFLLVLIGCGSVTPVDGNQPPLLVAALCFGLLVATLAESIGHVSGCHINPAVTVAMLVTGKIQLVKAVLYIVVQCVAAVVGTGVLKALTPGSHDELLFGYTKIASKLSALQGFGIEFILTFVLVFIIFAATDEYRTDLKGSAPIAIGLGLAALVLYGGPLTGAGLNPARVLGPCVILGQFENHWIYWLGPIGGAVVAAAFYQHIFRALRPDEIIAEELEMEKRSRERESSKENGGVTPGV